MTMAPAQTGIQTGTGIRRHFTVVGAHPYDQVTWDRRDSRITNFKDGAVAFEQTGVEVPADWSLHATNILAQKYFRGTLDTPERETSLRQVADRVVDTITAWGRRDGYFADDAEAAGFADELKYLIVTQRAAFNSPVWFNIGVAGVPQQASACQPYGALVSTPDGLVPIGRIVEQKAVGTKVFDANGITKVVAVKANGRKQILRVHCKAGYTLDVTPDHLVWRASGMGTGQFVEAGALRPGDQVEWHRTESYGEGEITSQAIAEAALAGSDLLARGVDMVVPETLFTAPQPVVAAYLRSMFQAEGYVSVRERGAVVGLDMVSEDLVRGLQRLLLRFGIFSRVRFKGDRRADRLGCWSLSIRPLGDRARFATEVGFVDPRKAALLEASLDLPGIRSGATKRLEIDRIEDLGVDDVYDIQTESGEYLSDNLRVHNCFILSVEDTMDSILNWYREEGTIFKGGSGAGINLSKIRSSAEALQGGGTASGPVSFMRGADASAGTIKSGGKTRRAAKMVILDVDHPDIEDFVWCKAVEERKARVLRDAGFDMDLDGKDSYSIQYQNANNSVRVTDEFMQAVVDDEVWELKAVTTGEVVRTARARDLMRQISQATWECADPGMQFDTTINRWHTAAATGRINGSNPCFTGDALVHTDKGLIRFDELIDRARSGESFGIYTHDATNPDAPAERLEITSPEAIMVTGTNEIVRLRFDNGMELRCTPAHRIFTANRGYVEARELTSVDEIKVLNLPAPAVNADLRLPVATDVAAYHQKGDRTSKLARLPEKWTPEFAHYLGWLNGDGATTSVPWAIQQAPPEMVAAYLQGLFDAGGCVYDGANSRHVGLESSSRKFLGGVQVLLTTMGIFSRVSKAREGFYDLRISGRSIGAFANHVGFTLSSKADKLARLITSHSFNACRETVRLVSSEDDGVEVTYNLSEPRNHSYIVNGVVVRNCSEYMHLDDSACNLASINLLKFLDEDADHFDVDGFRQAVEVIFTAQEILVGNADYPTESIAETSRRFRQLGIGYANLGAMLMALGLPYDSDGGRAWAGAVTALMTGHAYVTSARMAARMGPFAGFAENAPHMLGVLGMHRAEASGIDEELVPPDLLGAAQEAWDLAVDSAERYGVRNSQASVIAPTGTIGLLMDCDTTGLEPDLGLCKTKKLVGGGTMSIVNQTVPRALGRLGYDAEAVEAIIAYIDENKTILGAPGLAPEHVAVFACSMGDNAIHYMGHIRMMAAIQPFISGALSKTVNMPEEVSVEDVEQLHIDAWRLGIKAVAIYRDNCKVAQPLSMTTKETKTDALDAATEAVAAGAAPAEVVERVVERIVKQPVRQKLPRNRASRTFEFRVADCKGFVTVGEYDDGRPGEVFMKVAKQGSTLAGIMDAFAISVSYGLQYGVPLRAFVSVFTNMRFEPAGMTDDSDIRFASSLVDYIFRRLAVDYLPLDERMELGILSVGERVNPTLPGIEEATTATSSGLDVVASPPSENTVSVDLSDAGLTVRPPNADAPMCFQCGVQMQRAGSCHACPSCGTTSGCS